MGSQAELFPFRHRPGTYMLPSSQQLIDYVQSTPGKRTREIAAHFSVTDNEFEELVDFLFQHQMDGSVLRVPHAGWDVPERTSYRAGTLEVARGGQGFVRVASGTIQEEDVFVPPDSLRGALPGDFVLLRLEGAKRNGRGRREMGTPGRLREGSVVDVLRRSRRPVRGKFSAAKGKGGMVKLADRRFTTEVYIPPEGTGGARDGDRVLVRLTEEPPRGEHPSGRVLVRLLDEGTHASDLATVRELFELPGEHPAPVLAEAQALPAVVPGASWPDRLDLRNHLVFTIDPVDAKDFDDAISIERGKSGEVRLGVHIADVSHYVRPGSLLDKEASVRGTSIYLPGQVIPMLPERLANDLCSLRPGEDRLTKTVNMTFSARGELKRVEIHRSVIRSQRRFTYEEALAILNWLETGKGSKELPPDHAAYVDALRAMAQVRDKLHEARRRRGALYLEIPKLRLTLDAERNVIGLGRDERDPSHALIEEFMLAANEAVAQHLIEAKLPVVTRVHPPPEDKKLSDFRRFLDALEVRFQGTGTQEDLQRLIDHVKDDPLAGVIQLALLRTMGHAEYISGPGLHFALATEAYCHFTSPIRRYPDLLVHQLLDQRLDGRLAKATVRREWDERLPKEAEESSRLERRAEEAERDMTSLRLVRYLKPLVGQEMDGRITSVHPFGFFVRDENSLVEGLVHVATLGDDFYEFDPEERCLEGRRRRKRFGLGDRVRVELVEADPDERAISFRLKKRIGGPRA